MLMTFLHQAEEFSGIAKVTCRFLVLAKSVPGPATQNFICPVNEESRKALLSSQESHRSLFYVDVPQLLVS